MSDRIRHCELEEVKMADSARLYVVSCYTEGDLGPYDAVYGYEPVLFTSEEAAARAADNLSTTGDWPGGQPEYSWRETTLGEIRSTFARALDRGIA